MRKFLLTLALFMAIGFTPLAQSAQAWVGVRVGIGVPLYVGPRPYYGGYGYYGYGYYPPPYVVAPPPPVIYQAAPQIVTVPQPPPPVQTCESCAPSAAPVTQNAYSAPLPKVSNIVATSHQSSPQVDALVQQLSQPGETVRRDAAIQLGRMKAGSAVNELQHLLGKDSSPMVREGAARALGLIASPASLQPLIYAAQADDDREVRRSAQFAVEVIRSNLRRN